jgi:8-hydroxy-5-deazaflavin:NADPH oxidoreductase
MEVAVIGAGRAGRGLANAFIGAGHSVTLTAKDPGHAESLAAETGAHASASNRDAARAAEIVVLAVPPNAIEEVLDEIADAFDAKILIDVTNRLNFEDPASALDGGSNAEDVQARAPGARVVKAFNTTFAVHHAQPVVDGVQLDALVASDDDGARAKVMELVGAIGFRPIDVGPLFMARVLESMELMNMLLQIRHNWPWQTEFKLIGPTQPA